jgi:uncharacterized protein
MALIDFNPWWKDGVVPPALTGRKRAVLDEVVRYLDTRQMLLFTGLRRAGKTTLMLQIVAQLLKRGVDRYHIFYFSFDERRDDLEILMKEYEVEVAREDLAGKRVYLFFDEIQKLKDWSSRIKILYDLNPSFKCFLSGSAQINLMRESRESLAGRFFDFVVTPLTFDEYLAFQGQEIDRDRESFFEKTIRQSLEGYLRTGGFIEALSLDEGMLRRYFRESLIERVIFADIPAAFRFDVPELLYRLLNVVASRPGLYLDYKSLGNDLDVDQRTVSQYFSYLVYSLFVQRLYNYSANLLRTEKKLKRVYLSSTAFTFALNPQAEWAAILEQFFVNLLGATFFLRTPQKEEIDIIYVREGTTIPVEVKIRDTVRRSDAAFMMRYMVRNDLKNGLIITKDLETKYVENEIEVRVIPYWKYWSIEKWLRDQIILP